MEKGWIEDKTWHETHVEQSTIPERIADSVASFIGSWKFIILQSTVMALWVTGNVFQVFHFDPYPFVFLNLFMSAEAAFSTPLIMMAQNRQSDRDRHQADADYRTNVQAKEEIEALELHLAAIEEQKLDEILLYIKENAKPKPKTKKRS